MFIYSLRASTLKFVGIIGAALIVLVTLIVLVPGDRPVAAQSSLAAAASPTVYRFDKIKTPEDRIAFLRQFGWEVNPEPIEEAEVTIPAEFDKVFAGYNELQKSQGLDLGRYRNKTVTRCTYEVTNYAGYEGRVWANLLIYRGKVIGGDICTADVNGFIHGFEKK